MRPRCCDRRCGENGRRGGVCAAIARVNERRELCYQADMAAPLVVGIAGATGSGKTLVAERLAAAVEGHVTMLQHDSYYRDRADLSYEERCALNFDHPDALETPLLIEHVKALRAGQSIGQPSYDFTTHRRKTELRTVSPAPVIIVEGILVLAEAELRALFDIKIYVDTDADIRVFRRIRRDIEQRGRSFESVRQQYYRTVRPMTLQFVEPSRRWADIIVPEGGDNEVALDLLSAKLRSVVGVGFAHRGSTC